MNIVSTLDKYLGTGEKTEDFEEENDNNIDEEEQEDEEDDDIDVDEGEDVEQGDDEVEDEEDDEEENEYDIDIESNKNISISFDETLRSSYIKEHHPELRDIPYDEMKSLTHIIRNTQGNVVDKLHTTIPILTKFEKAKIIGIRTNQLNNGSHPLFDVDETVYIANDKIAEIELGRRLLPFIVVRPIPNGKREFWNVSDLELLDV